MTRLRAATTPSGEGNSPGQGDGSTPRDGGDNSPRTGAVWTQRTDEFGGEGEPGDRGHDANNYAAGEPIHVTGAKLPDGEYTIVVYKLGPGGEVWSATQVPVEGGYLDYTISSTLFGPGQHKVEVRRADGTKVVSDNFRMRSGDVDPGDDANSGNSTTDPGGETNPGGSPDTSDNSTPRRQRQSGRGQRRSGWH